MCLVAGPSAVFGQHDSVSTEPNEDEVVAVNLAEQLEKIRAANAFPGLAAGYILDGQLKEIVVAGNRRIGSDAKIESSDLFHIGSCTKAMTATLAALLVEEGVITFDTTLAETFPDDAHHWKPMYRDVTLAEFLNHRSGLKDDRSPSPLLFGRIRSLDGSMVERRVKLMNLVLSFPGAGEPGKSYAYSNSGYAIAAAMLEKKTGASWEELIQSRLFDPLGMTSAGFGAPQSPSDGTTLGYEDTPEQPWGHQGGEAFQMAIAPGPFADNPAVLRPAGGVHLALGDWAKFIIFHLYRSENGGKDKDGKQLIPADHLERLHVDLQRSKYANGWLLLDREWGDGPVLNHAGSNTMWFAVVWVAPQKNSAFFVITNCMNSNAIAACDGVVGSMIQKHMTP